MQRPDLAVDHDGVGTLLAAEVLVDHGLADPGTRGDLLDRGSLETALGEQFPGDGQQLLPTLGSSHAHPRAAGAGGGGG